MILLAVPGVQRSAGRRRFYFCENLFCHIIYSTRILIFYLRIPPQKHWFCCADSQISIQCDHYFSKFTNRFSKSMDRIYGIFKTWLAICGLSSLQTCQLPPNVAELHQKCTCGTWPHYSNTNIQCKLVDDNGRPLRYNLPQYAAAVACSSGGRWQ